MDNKPRLGRGLSALLGEAGGGDGASVGSPSSDLLPVEMISQNPFQPRKSFDPEEIARLGESIRSHGVLQPLVVRKIANEYQLIAGERRLRAAQSIGMREVPVRIVELDDQQAREAALVENIQRADLNAIEKAQSFKEYLDRYHISQEQLATRLGMDRTSVSNLVNLLNLPTEVQDAVRLEQISQGHAKILKGLTNPQQQIALCKEVMVKALSVKALELLVKQQKADAAGGEQTPKPESAQRPAAEKTAHVQSIEDELRQRLAVKLEIKLRAKEKGQFILHFETNDDFERILTALQS